VNADKRARHGASVFGGFEEANDARSTKRWFASTGTSLLVFVVVGIGLVVLAKQQTSEAKEDPPIDVTFRGAPEASKPEPPPPPPPPPPKTHAPRPKKPGKVAPLQPQVIPETRPDEAEPTGHFDATAAQEEYGDGLGGAAPVAAAPPPPPPPPPPVREERIPDPISEIDPGVVAPRARGENVMPVYPESARKKGVEAEVILKIKIDARGDVIAVDVVHGAEPFASAAKAAVERWKYTPAVVDGKPSAFVKLVKIPFRLHA
jgi:protein TonB